MMRLFFAVLALAAAFVVWRATPAPRSIAIDARWAQCLAQPSKRCIFDRARENAATTKPPHQRLHALAQLARGEVDAGLRTEALSDARALLEFARTIDHDEERQEKLAVVVAVQAKAGEFAAAQETARTLKRDYWIERAAFSIAVELTKAGRTGEGVRLLEASADAMSPEFVWDLRDLIVNRAEEALVIPLLQRAQDRADARADEFRFFTGIHHPSEFEPPILIIAAPLTRAGRADAALKLARQMKLPSSRATVLGGIGRIIALSGRTDAALALARDVADPKERGLALDRMFAPTAWEGDDDLFGPISPNAGPAATKAFAAAMAAAAAFASEAERDSAFAVIAAINARAGATANGLAAARQVREPHDRFFALLTTAEAMANAGKGSESIDTFAEAQAAALRYDAPADLLSPLAQSQAKAGQIEQALKVVEVMQGKKSRSSSTMNGKAVDHNRGFALYEIAKAMAKVGRTREALKLARQTEWDGGGIMHGVGVMAEGLAEAGRIDEALEAAQAQTNSGRCDNLLLDIIRSRVAAGRFDDARKLIRGIDRDVERAQALLAIGSGLIAKGAKANGRAAISDALKLTTGMEYENLALDILVDAGKMWPE
ncbi:MAG: hypothetical protein ABL996_01730 [Micropepsaceae bacterium]